MFTLLYVAAVIIMLVFGVMIVASITKGRLTATALEDLKRELVDEQFILGSLASFQGRASFGAKQVTGDGALVLTARQLVFKMAMPERKVAISLQSVSDADRAKDVDPHVKALAVHFHDEKADVDDVAVWLVDDVDDWVRQIRGARLRATMGDDPRPPQEILQPGGFPGGDDD